MAVRNLSELKNTNRTFDYVLESMVTKQDLDFTQNTYMSLDSTSAGPGIYSLPECLMLGLNPTWIQNFGGAALAAGDHTTDVHMLDVLTPVNTLFKMSLALARFASQNSAVTAAQAAQVFGMTGAAGSLINMSNVATGTTDIIPAAKSVNTLSGTSTANVSLTGQSDLASDQDMALILFDNYTLEAGHVLDVETHTNNEHLAAACEVVVTGAGTNVLDRQGATTDGHQNIIFTASGVDTVILPGSFIYLNPGADGDELAIKGCLRTTGGTIAMTYAS